MSEREPLRPGSIALTWLRQAGFLVEGPSAAVVIDPFLTDLERQHVAPVRRPEELGWVDLVLATHEHEDHLDLPAWRRLAASSPRPLFVVPEPLRARVIGGGIEAARLIGARSGEPIEVHGVRVTPVPAMHGVEVEDAYGFGRGRSGGLVRYLGYVVDLDGVRVYHAGDSLAYHGLAARLRRLDVHVALLPINGRDAVRERRGIVGNMDARQAAGLASSAGLDLAIPMHYDTVPGNTASPGAFVDRVRAVRPSPSVAVPERGARFVYTVPSGRRVAG